MYNTIKINTGDGGWGGPLTVTPTDKCHTVLSVTGGGIHPVAQKIADLSGGVAVDGWKTTLPDDEIMVAVVDCGGSGSDSGSTTAATTARATICELVRWPVRLVSWPIAM